MMATLRVLVADDELLARKRLARLVGAIEGAVLAGECESGEGVLARLLERDVDVVLLDIHMPGLTGLETLELLPEEGPVVVLCTAHPDHAVEAFEQGAADYVMKPVEAGRLKKALGPKNVFDEPPIVASEDFGVFGLERNRIPIVMFRLGAMDPEKFAAAEAAGTVLPDPITKIPMDWL